MRHVVRTAEKVQSDLKSGQLPVVGRITRVPCKGAQPDQFVPLVKKVIAQTKARVLGGNTHVVGKVLSLFEVHTQAIRKGKAHKPTEFGRLVQVDEVENGIVSNYDVKDGNPADVYQWTPSVSHHKAPFAPPPTFTTPHP